MYKIFIRILAAFIPNKRKRKAFRNKYLHGDNMPFKQQTGIQLNLIKSELQKLSSREFFTEQTINAQFDSIRSKLDSLSGQINYITNFLKKTTDVSNAPKAKGILRQVQELNLEVLSEVDRICRKHKLSYWLDFGTLLGAMRHQGFIPWDDDIDIGMPIDDFKKFCEIVEDEAKSKNSVCYFKKVPSQIGKCLHKNFIPQTDDEWVDFIFWRLKGKLSFATDIFPYYFSNADEAEIRSVIEQGCAQKTALFDKFKTYNDFKEVESAIDAIQKPLASDSGKVLFLGLETRVYQPHLYNTSDVFPLKETKFEGHSFSIPNNWQKILIRTYGNYLEIPADNHTHLYISELNDEELNKLNKMKELHD